MPPLCNSGDRHIFCSAKWSKEADKRNAYFEKYGITTVTFTDIDLTDVDQCWEYIKGILDERSAGPLTVEGAELELQAAYASVSV